MASPKSSNSKPTPKRRGRPPKAKSAAISKNSAVKKKPATKAAPKRKTSRARRKSPVNHNKKDGKFTKGNTAAKLKIEIDWDQVDYLAEIQCSQEEIAGFFGVDLDTLISRCKEKHQIPFSDYLKPKRAKGRTNLRHRQFLTANGEKGKVTITKKDGTKIEREEYIVPPNATMQIWLGKNTLGQKDKHEISGEVKVRRYTIEKVTDESILDG